ncbi:MAG: peptidase M16 [Candidatus Latescibacteria bacterium]|nr:peptidase M16 [Candidatus Latescibacterota bacterium]
MDAHGFTLLRRQEIAELDTLALLYRHRCGAQLLSLVNDYDNKVFGATFRTPPSDSTGVPHILEHAVLCGSRKYPVKEPFLELLKGSLNTYLNAFTYPDKTCYPVASQNLKDFYNLVDVYLDAVFHPRLTPLVLQQEGWHYELHNADDPLTYQGIVFNEMKGAYAAPEEVLAQRAQHSLFPNTPYRHDAGGDPRHIPELTFADFVAFHRRFYHPANSLLFFCGDDDPDHRLALLADYLNEFDAAQIDSAIPTQPAFEGPRRQLLPYAVEADADEQPTSMVAVNWLLAPDLSADTLLALQLLEYILVGIPASPLRQALIDSGLGEDLVNTGLDIELRQPCFSVGLKGLAPENTAAVEELVMATLEEVVQRGIHTDMIAAAINTTAFHLRENNTGSYPRGLALMLRALSTWLYDGDPIEAVAFAQSFDRVQINLAEDGYLEALIQTHLLDNQHRTVLTLAPDPDLDRRLESEEKERLAAAGTAMSSAEKRATVEATSRLRKAQETPDDPRALARLPHLNLDDLQRPIKTTPRQLTSCGSATVLYHELSTNGIVYLDLGFNLHSLPQDYLPYLSLFGRALLEMGTHRQDYAQLSQRIGIHTGGLWTQPFVSARRTQAGSAAYLFLRAKALSEKVPELLAILRDILLATRLDDRERFRQLVLEEKAGEESDLVPSGQRLVGHRLRGRFDEAAWAAEQMRGLNYLFFLRQLLRDVEDNWDAVQQRLESLRQLLLQRQNILANAILSSHDKPTLERDLEKLLDQLPDAPVERQTWYPAYHHMDEGLVAVTPVNFVGKAVDLYQLGYQLHGSVIVIARYLSNTYLWDQVRVQGGAYDAHCSFDHFTGVFNYGSYRDPRLLETLAAYDGAGAFLENLQLDEDELARAIIGTIGDLDQPQLPDAQGYTSLVRYLTGTDDDFRQQLRNQILDTRPEHFRAFGAVLSQAVDQGEVVVMGGRAGLEGLKAAHDRPLELVETH